MANLTDFFKDWFWIGHHAEYDKILDKEERSSIIIYKVELVSLVGAICFISAIALAVIADNGSGQI